MPPSPHFLWFCGSHEHSHFFTGESSCCFPHSSSSFGREYSQPHAAQISINFCDEFTA